MPFAGSAQALEETELRALPGEQLEQHLRPDPPLLLPPLTPGRLVLPRPAAT
jgi:hypothetical protein